jgi:hypothetical protein
MASLNQETVVPAKWLLKNGWPDQELLVLAISLPTNERPEPSGR